MSSPSAHINGALIARLRKGSLAIFNEDSLTLDLRSLIPTRRTHLQLHFQNGRRRSSWCRCGFRYPYSRTFRLPRPHCQQEGFGPGHFCISRWGPIRKFMRQWVKSVTRCANFDRFKSQPLAWIGIQPGSLCPSASYEGLPVSLSRHPG